MRWLAGLADAQLREAREQVPQFERAYVALGEHFVDAFGAPTLTPHAQAIAETVAGRRLRRQLVA